MPSPTFTIGTISFVNELLPEPAEGKTNSASDASIGAPVMMVVPITLDTPGFAGQYWRVNPMLFQADGSNLRTPQNVYWIAGTKTGAVGVYVMSLFTNNSGHEESNKNLSAEMHILSTTEAEFRFRMRLTMDLGGPINVGMITNAHRLLKGHKNDPEVFATAGAPRPLSVPSVYQVNDRVAGVAIECVSGMGISESITTGVASTPYSARYFNKGLPTATGTQPNAELLGTNPRTVLLRGGVEVSNLSRWENTTVKLYLANTGGTAAITDGFMVYLLKTEQYPNVAGYLDDYGTQGSLITNYSPDLSSAGGNIFVKHPHVSFDGVGAEEQFFLQWVVGPELELGVAYTMVVVCNGYMVGAIENRFSNTFVIPSLYADALPPPVSPTGVFEASIANYGAVEQPNKVVATVGDRLLLTMHVKGGVYNANLGESAFGGGFVEDLHSVWLTINDVTNGTTRTVRSLVEFAGVEPSLRTANTNMKVERDGEDYVFTFLVHLGYPNNGSHPDYSDAKVLFTWKFLFRYDITPEEHECVYQFTQEAQVRGFDTDGDYIEAINLFDAATGLPLDNLCYTERILVEVLLNPSKTEEDTWTIRAFASPEPYGYLPGTGPLLTQEEDTCAPLEGGPEALGAEVITMENCTMEDRRATFVVDATQFAEMSRWRIMVVVQGPMEEEVVCCHGGPLELYINPAGGQPYILGASDRENVWTDGPIVSGARSWVADLGDGNVFTIQLDGSGRWYIASVTGQGYLGTGSDGQNPCTVTNWYNTEDGVELLTPADMTLCGQFIE